MIQHLKGVDQYISPISWKASANMKNAITLKEMGLKRKNKKIKNGVSLGVY